MAQSRYLLLLLYVFSTPDSAHSLPELSIAKIHSNIVGGVGRRAVGPQDNEILTEPAWGSLTYFTKITVGTPPQSQTVLLDTGSSDLYFDSSSAAPCQLSNANSSSGCRGGSFDSSRSTTFSTVNAPAAFDTRFGDASFARGIYATDVVSIGNVAISGVQFGLAENLNITSGGSVGILGLGYYTIEGVNTTSALYPNLVDVMAHAGVINSRLYSIYLGNTDYNSGNILFGGIDTTKYSGFLTTLNILPTMQSNGTIDSVLTEPVISITAATVAYEGTNFTIFEGGIDGAGAYRDANSFPVILDVGSSAWYLPSPWFENLMNAFPYLDQSGTCSCASIPHDETITLTFGGEIEITYNATQFIVPLIDLTSGNQVLGPDKSVLCTSLIGKTTSNATSILGAGFLRSMYIVYDLDNAQVSIAQALPNVTETPNVVEIPAGPNQIASAISHVAVAASNTLLAPSPSSQLFTISNSVSTITTSSIPTPTSATEGTTASSPNAPPQSTPPFNTSLSSAAKAGIGVGVALGSCIVIAISWFFWRLRRPQSGADATGENVTSDHSYNSTLAEPPPNQQRPMSETSGFPIFPIGSGPRPAEMQTDPRAELEGGSRSWELSGSGARFELN